MRTTLIVIVGLIVLGCSKEESPAPQPTKATETRSAVIVPKPSRESIEKLQKECEKASMATDPRCEQFQDVH